MVDYWLDVNLEHNMKKYNPLLRSINGVRAAEGAILKPFLGSACDPLTCYALYMWPDFVGFSLNRVFFEYSCDELSLSGGKVPTPLRFP